MYCAVNRNRPTLAFFSTAISAFIEAFSGTKSGDASLMSLACVATVIAVSIASSKCFLFRSLADMGVEAPAWLDSGLKFDDGGCCD
jgi:hypothetical protein